MTPKDCRIEIMCDTDIDCHVLAATRDEKTIWSFLDAFLPERECSIEGWLVGQNEEQEITDVNELIKFCIEHTTEAQSIYWDGLNSCARRSAWVFFTDDAAMICGLTCDEESDAQQDQLLGKLQKHLGSNVGYISCNTSPPHSATGITSTFNSIHGLSA